MAKKLYYLDKSCGPGFDAIFKRTQYWAKRALERLDDPTDIDFARVYNIIFKTPKTDTELVSRCESYSKFWKANGSLTGDARELRPRPIVDHVRRELSGLASGWRRTEVRDEADVRIHCCDHQRWTYRTSASDAKNWVDPVNYVVQRTDARPGREWNDRWAQVCGYMSMEQADEAKWRPEGQNPTRAVVDLSDRAVRLLAKPWDDFCARELPRGGSDELRLDDVLFGTIECTLVHEVMHTPAYLLVDFFRDGNTGGWPLIMGLKKSEAYKCAEAVTVLCTCAVLADHGYTIDRSWDDVPGVMDIRGDKEPKLVSSKWMLEPLDARLPENQAVLGVIKAYKDITGSVSPSSSSEEANSDVR